MLATPIKVGSLYESAVRSAPMNGITHNSEPHSGQRSAAVMAAGVIAILGSVVTAIGILIAMMGLLISFGQPSPFEAMPQIRAMSIVFLVVSFAVAIWGAFSGVALIRSRNWARVSVLIWSGITSPICAIVIISMFFFPIPEAPHSVVTAAMIRVFTAIFYGGPLAIAVWWLILFTRPAVVAQFKPAAEAASGDPFGAIPVAVQADGSAAAVAYALPAPLPTPSVPVPVTVLACFFLLSALSLFFVFFIHVPAMVFGHAFTGLTGSVVYATWCVLYAISGVGMLKRLLWAYSVAIGVQILGIVSAIMTLLSPDFDAMMRRAISTMSLPASPELYQMPSMAHLRGFSIIGMLFPLAILGLLVYYRPRFLDACAVKRASATSPAIEPLHSRN
jgi:hypothetical protein